MKEQNKCAHDWLEAVKPNYSAVSCTTTDEVGCSGYFMFKKYLCLNCGKIITILNAVVENVK
jgi:hypothetical protein